MLALADERSGDPANSGRGCQVSDKLAIGAARDCHATGGNMAAISKSQAGAPARRDDAAGDVFEHVTHAINVAYYQWVRGHDELYVSSALSDLFGYEPGTWTLQRSWDAIHPDDRPGHRTARIAHLKGQLDRAEFTFRARTASGEWRWLRDQTTVERDATGRATRLVGVIADISKARQCEAELQAAKTEVAARDAEIRALMAGQAASIEVLKAISSSPDDTQPVFQLIARRTRELCDAVEVGVTEYDGALLHMRALEGYELPTPGRSCCTDRDRIKNELRPRGIDGQMWEGRVRASR